MEIIKVILTSLLSAAVLFLLAKIMGHKQISQLDFFDYITGITIGSIAAELATELEDPLWYYFDIQLRQIFWYWVLGMALGSAVSVAKW